MYANCKIDYSGSWLTPSNLLSLLKGDPNVGSKPLLSDQSSNIFLYMVNNGAPGMIQMPNDHFLYADDLRDTIQFMYDNKMYDKMVIYADSPESSTFFKGLKYEEVNVYAVSSSHSTQWGTYCTPDEVVQGKHIKTCMANLFSAIWLEDLGKHTDENTLNHQFARIKSLTPKTNIQ